MPAVANGKILAAVSGGADSVALLRVLAALGCNCIAAHCNFHLRGDEADRDEAFVRKLCHDLDIELRCTDFDVEAYKKSHGVSTEMACRELRYDWFERQRAALGCSVIAVAHHRDDNIETFFLNLVRGSGITGLAGIKPCNGKIVRPLLGFSRDEIINYLKTLDSMMRPTAPTLKTTMRATRYATSCCPKSAGCFHRRWLESNSRSTTCKATTPCGAGLSRPSSAMLRRRADTDK